MRAWTSKLKSGSNLAGWLTLDDIERRQEICAAEHSQSCCGNYLLTAPIGTDTIARTRQASDLGWLKQCHRQRQ